MPGPEPLHRQPFRVQSLGPSTLCAFLQEAAGRDADERGFGMSHFLGQGLAWMLQRLVVEVAAWPAAEDEIAVITWPTSFGGAIAKRVFVVEGGHGAVQAQASSRWALVDLGTRRAVRLPDSLRRTPVPSAGVAVRIGPAPAAPRDGTALEERRVEIGDGDLDVLGHANNTRYVQWGMDAVPDAWLEAHELCAFDVAFRREALRGEILTSRAFRAGDDTLAHALVRAEDAEVVATLRTRWR
jgi:medium-chain acyl-[acyl-carrier-protein] hydrolase